MYCIFLETGNNSFLSHITEAICKKIVCIIIRLYKEGLFTDSDGNFNKTKAQKQMPSLKNVLRFLNCSWFIEDKCTSTIEKECEADHITALASDQIKLFGKIMSDTKTSIISDKNSNLSPKERLGLHTLITTCIPANTHQIEELKFNRENHDEYLVLYAEKADEMKDKADGFMYVRAKDPSDYGKFMSFIKKLSAVTPCDHLQAI